MKSAQISVDKVEIVDLKISTNEKFSGEISQALCQLEYNFQGTRFSRAVGLNYAEEDAADPKLFIFSIKLKLANEEQDETVTLPYEIESRVRVYMKYKADRLHGAERFRAVRATGYAIAYGAIREMVANITARSQHGIWFLPAADFNSAAAEESLKDEENRKQFLENQAPSEEANALKPQPSRKRTKAKKIQDQ